MATAENPIQYPDVLGALTGGQRVNFGVIQCALTLRDDRVAAGRTAEALLLVQNACDQTTDVSIQVRVPEQDAKKRKGRFLTHPTKLVLAIKPGEVGYFTIPIATLPDTALGEYKFSIEIAAQTAEKPTRVRSVEGGGAFTSSMLGSDSRQRYDAISSLRYSTNKPALRNALEAALIVDAPRPALPPELKPQWHTLWSLADAGESFILARYGDLIAATVFPRFKRTLIYAPLLEVTKARFTEGGYDIREAEAAVIAKIMALILEYASPQQHKQSTLIAGIYAVEPVISAARKQPDRALPLPHWIRAYLRLVAQDERALHAIDRLIAGRLYLPLLRDAIEYAFTLVSQTTGQILGEEEEIKIYSNHILDAIEQKGGLDFQHVYLPLIMGGTLINDKILLPGEEQDEQVGHLVSILLDRQHEIAPEDADVLDLVQETIHRVTKIYGNREPTQQG